MPRWPFFFKSTVSCQTLKPEILLEQEQHVEDVLSVMLNFCVCWNACLVALTLFCPCLRIPPLPSLIRSGTGALAIFLRRWLQCDITTCDYSDASIESNIRHNCTANGLDPLPHIQRQCFLCPFPIHI